VARRGAVVLATLAFNGATDQIMAELHVLVHKLRKHVGEGYTVNFDGTSTWGGDLAKVCRDLQSNGEPIVWTALEMKGDKSTSPVLREARCCRLVDAYYLNLQIRLRTDAAIPFDPVLREELLFAEFREDQEDGGAKLISKRTYRKQLGRSPDLSDALAFCFWEGRVAPGSDVTRRIAAERAAQPEEHDEPANDHGSPFERPHGDDDFWQDSLTDPRNPANGGRGWPRNDDDD
jgi:hypothetical protein